MSEDQSYCEVLTIFFLFLDRLRQIFAQMILWSKHSFNLFIYLFINI